LNHNIHYTELATEIKQKSPVGHTGLLYQEQSNQHSERPDFPPLLLSQESMGVLVILRKEVIQPQVPLRLPCYNLVPVIGLTVGSRLPEWLANRSSFNLTP